MFAVVNMLPALLLAMPISAAWTPFLPEVACKIRKVIDCATRRKIYNFR
jgi:hypothetical protein